MIIIRLSFVSISITFFLAYAFSYKAAYAEESDSFIFDREPASVSKRYGEKNCGISKNKLSNTQKPIPNLNAIKNTVIQDNLFEVYYKGSAQGALDCMLYLSISIDVMQMDGFGLEYSSEYSLVWRNVIFLNRDSVLDKLSAIIPVMPNDYEKTIPKKYLVDSAKKIIESMTIPNAVYNETNPDLIIGYEGEWVTAIWAKNGYVDKQLIILSGYEDFREDKYDKYIAEKRIIYPEKSGICLESKGKDGKPTSGQEQCFVGIISESPKQNKTKMRLIKTTKE